MKASRLERRWRARARALAWALIGGTLMALAAALCGGCQKDRPYRHEYTADRPPIERPFRPIEEGPLPRPVTPAYAPPEAPAPAGPPDGAVLQGLEDAAPKSYKPWKPRSIEGPGVERTREVARCAGSR